MKEDPNFDCEIKSFPFVLLVTIEITCPSCFSDMIKSLKSFIKTSLKQMRFIFN